MRITKRGLRAIVREMVRSNKAKLVNESQMKTQQVSISKNPLRLMVLETIQAVQLSERNVKSKNVLKGMVKEVMGTKNTKILKEGVVNETIDGSNLKRIYISGYTPKEVTYRYTRSRRIALTIVTGYSSIITQKGDATLQALDSYLQPIWGLKNGGALLYIEKNDRQIKAVKTKYSQADVTGQSVSASTNDADVTQRIEITVPFEVEVFIDGEIQPMDIDSK